MNRTNHRPRRVDFFSYNEDFECAYLGALGFSTRYIQEQTKLGGGQVNYRLKKANVRRMDYRNGTSAFAQTVMASLRPRLTRDMREYLRTGL